MYSSNTYTVFDLKISQYIPRLWDSKVTQYFLGPEHGPLRYFPSAHIVPKHARPLPASKAADCPSDQNLMIRGT